MKFETRQQETDERLAERLTETPAQRRQRTAKKTIDLKTAQTIRAALGACQGRPRKNARPKRCTVASLVIATEHWTAIKRRAARQGTNASALVAKLVKEFLEGEERRPT